MSDDLDWLPASGVWLRDDELRAALMSLRAALDGTALDEPNRAHLVQVAMVLARGLARSEHPER